MLILAIVFALIVLTAVACWAICESVIAKYSPSLLLRGSDWNVLWAGVLFQAVALLALSLFVPLNGYTGIAFWGGIWLVVTINPKLRRRVKSILNLGSASLSKFAICLLFLGVALYASQSPCNYDTLLYHHQATRWFAEHGAVQGLGLLHFRFGFVSSTFALAAPFEAILPHRTGTIVNGVALLIALMQIVQAGSAILRRKATQQDWFASLGLSAVLALHLLFLEPVSAAPDFFVNVATVAIATNFIGLAMTSPRSQSWTSFVAAALLPTVKLSAAPVAMLAAVAFVVWRGSDKFRTRACWTVAFAVFAVLPLVGVSWWHTGNLLFPLSVLQTDTPWTIADGDLKEISHEIRDWARWGGKQPDGVAESEWVMRWLKSSKGALFVLATLGNLIAILAILRPAYLRKGLSRELIIPSIGIFGALYLFFAAPNPRFGFGMLMLGWAWVGQWIMPMVCSYIGFSPKLEEQSSPFKSRLTPRERMGTAFVAGMGCLVLLALCVKPMDAWRKALNNHLSQRFFDSQDGRINWLRPATVPTIGYLRNDDGSISKAFDIEFVDAQVNDVKYSHPLGTDITGARHLPAAIKEIHGIRLAKPDVGIRGGFQVDGK